MATLGLGTVQFGLNYGISNHSGRPSLNEIEKILKHLCAQEFSTPVIDTARNYGESELVLGEYSNITSNAQVITKIPPLKRDEIPKSICEYYQKILQVSLERLNLSSVHGLLTHHSMDFQTSYGSQIAEFLISAKKEKKCQRIGISAYSETEVQYVIDHFFVPDIVQLPMNIFDQKLIKTDFLKKLKNRGVEIHIRSAYLQGLIFIEPTKLNSYFTPIKEKLTQLHSFLSKEQIHPAHYALQFLNLIPEIDHILLGINHLSELIEALEFVKTPLNLTKENLNFSQWTIDDEKFTNPALWKIEK